MGVDAITYDVQYMEADRPSPGRVKFSRHRQSDIHRVGLS